MTVLLGPVRDINAFAKQLKRLGTVRQVDSNMITLIARKVEGPPPNADTVTKALFHLKLIGAHRRKEAVRVLKNTLPQDQRVAKSSKRWNRCSATATSGCARIPSRR